MSFFNTEVPLFSRKPSADAIVQTPGLWRIHWKIGNRVLWSSFYTRHDQACILWGLLTAGIFAIAQFLPLSWTIQAIFASLMTLLGVGGMIGLTWYFAKVERLNWVLYSWIALMLIGISITDLALLQHWGQVLLNVCPLWLGLSGIGYAVTGIGMRSRMFLLLGVLHLIAIWLLPLVAPWQQITTGFVISFSVLLMAELQWDANGVCGYQTASQEANLVAVDSLVTGV
ncbi:hypothetical protein H6F67_07525 [Microcoleus sp. FACHB-1515]|uniref:hypothetical protein n=1 Tax=Cyanophyceae TaxID=3028117 RepID=UPI001682D684|nr:hypothetical protein [Microcoleus sp. FACHB-1515]MBD2089701.1 hypothetical protein [Microcoleus sp. FACHB-1515]